MRRGVTFMSSKRKPKTLRSKTHLSVKRLVYVTFFTILGPAIRTPSTSNWSQQATIVNEYLKQKTLNFKILPRFHIHQTHKTPC